MLNTRLKLVTHNLRSCHNVGSLLRTAEGLGVEEVLLTGYTPYPRAIGDTRLPHQAAAVHSRIVRTSLGAEGMVRWRHFETWSQAERLLRNDGFTIVALEQASGAQRLPDFTAEDRVALVVGREVGGLEARVLTSADIIVAIPMLGNKESFNVVQAAAMALYQCRYR